MRIRVLLVVARIMIIYVTFLPLVKMLRNAEHKYTTIFAVF
jgi:hypothetical protein